MSNRRPLPLFSAFGLELEYMITDAQTGAVLPLADALLCQAAGEPSGDFAPGDGAEWSNELVRHVIEFKTAEPAPKLAGCAQLFQRQITRVNELLRTWGARLTPGGMHPWMNPRVETKLWDGAYADVYRTFHRIFDCHDHGWANMQSVHLNLPFGDDAEFARLHAAVRVLLPLLPALAAASPFKDGVFAGALDQRLRTYRTHTARVPSLTGDVVPEPIFSKQEYQNGLLAGLYRDIAPFDPEELLRHEWLNARGAIARFERNAIEIRVLDMQECPGADAAICCLIVRVLKALTGERWGDAREQRSWSARDLAVVLEAVEINAELSPLENEPYLRLFNYSGRTIPTAGELWRFLFDAVWPENEDDEEAGERALMKTILERGPLARRMLRFAGKNPDRRRLRQTADELSLCLAEGRLFGL